MCATFSPDDIDKTVENANGEVIGTVAEIEGDTAHVEPRSGVVDSIRAALGWKRAAGDTVVIRENAVETISDDVIRLESEPEEPETTRTDIDDDSRGSEGGEPNATGTDEPTPGTGAESDDTETAEPDVIVDRGPDPDEADGIESTEPVAEDDRTAPADPVEEMGGADELHPADESDDADEREGAADAHPAAGTGDADAATESDEPVADDPLEAEERSEFEAPSAADEIVDTDARDGLEETRAIDETASADETASTDESDATETDEPVGTSAVGESTGIGGSNDADDSSEPSETGRAERTGAESSGSAGADGVPDEAASTVDMAAERGATDGAQSTESNAAAGETADESGSAPATESADTDADANEIDRSVESDSFEDVSDGLDDADERPTEEMDLADELDTGIDIESTGAAADSGGSADAPETTAGERDLAEELDQGSDLESVAESDDSAGLEATTDSKPSEETDLVDELDRGPDIEPVADVDRETGPDIDPETISGEQTRTEASVETVDRRIVTEDDSDIDHRPAETAGEQDRTPLEDLESEPEGTASDEAASDDRSRSATPLSAMLAAQRAALEPSRQAVELQQRLARNAVSEGVALQRQQLRLAETVASAPFELAAAMLGSRESPSQGRLEESHAGPDRPDERVARDRTAALLERHVERLEELHRQLAADPDATHRRLELVDGLDSMYRQRLVDAGIDSLDDLARADSETVADAAEVTEKRAASWIEQADT